MKQPQQLQNGINKKLEKDVTWEYIREAMRPRIQKLQASLKPAKPAPYAEEYLEKLRQIMHQDTWFMLKSLQRDAYLFKTQLFKKIGVSKKKFDASTNWLQKNEIIKSVSCKTSKKTWADFFPLTEKAHELMRTPKLQRKPHPDRFRHTYYEIILQQSLEKQGYRPIKEYALKNSPEKLTITTGGREIEIYPRIDVYAEQEGLKTAYEVTLTLTTDAIMPNVIKCLKFFRVDRLYIVCENKAGIESAKEIIEKSNAPEEHLKKIGYKQISDFL